MTTNTTITHETLGITASVAVWRALGFTDYSNGGINSGPHGVEALLLYGVQATGGSRGEDAVIAAIVERDRRNAERTRVTAEARLGDAINNLAQQIGAESASALVARMPERIRPYAQAVLNAR